MGVKNETRKVLFIVNKFAGTGYHPDTERWMNDISKKNNAECSIEFTQGPGHATEIATAATVQGFDFVVAVGGDGTINEVSRGLVGSATPMGIIPRGSGNGLSRHLGIPLKIPQAIKTLYESEAMAIDTFRVNGKLSLNVSGIGFDGHIANLFGGKTKRGLTGYAKLTLKEFLQFQEFDAEIIADGKTFQQKAFIIAIANSSQYGNNARIAPTASVRDELLHLNVVRKIPAYRVDVVYSVFLGNVEKSSFCEVTTAKSIQIRTKQPVAYHVDGEPGGHNDQFEIEVVPASLRILVPGKSLKLKV